MNRRKDNTDSDLTLWTNLMMELSRYCDDGVQLYLNDEKVTPRDVADACIVGEETDCYMRDYITDGKGDLKEIRFDKVKDN